MTRTDFLMARRFGLGATDIANLAGVGFHNDAVRVWKSKVEDVDSDAGNVLMRMGLATEDLNAELYSAAMGVAISKPPAVITRHPEHSWAAASLDRITEDGKPVELKYTPFFSDSRWGDTLTDQIPPGYAVQTTWQMGVARSDMADVSALSGTGEHRVYRVGFDTELLRILLAIGAEFWKRFVEPRLEPPAQWRPEAAPDVAARILAINKDQSITLPEEYAPAAEQYLECRRIIKEAEEESSRLRSQLEHAMGESGKAIVGQVKVSKWLVPEAVITPQPYTRPAYVGFRVTQLKGKP